METNLKIQKLEEDKNVYSEELYGLESRFETLDEKEMRRITELEKLIRELQVEIKSLKKSIHAL